MHDEVGDDVSSGPSFGHDDPVFAKRSNQTMKPTPKAFAPHGAQAEQAGHIARQLQFVCHDTLDFIQVPGFPSAIRVFALTHSRRNIVQC